MADEDENIAGENSENMNQDMLDQCDSLRRSNLQLREEILRLERENAEFKKQSLIDKNNLKSSEHYENISGPTSIHVSSIDNDEKEESNNNDNYPTELVENLRAEILQLKKWKVKATQEIVDRDRALADLEAELVKQQGDFDTSSQECMGHQRVIQELKSQIDQVTQLKNHQTFHHFNLFISYRSVLEEKGHQVICQKDPFRVIAIICTHLLPVFLLHPYSSLRHLCQERGNFKAVLLDA